MKKPVLPRHGQSLWNPEKTFTGWTDVDLSDQGIQETRKAGKALKAAGYINAGFGKIIHIEALK